jgi:hypothetical protein
MNDAAERVFRQVQREQEVRMASVVVLRGYAPRSPDLSKAVAVLDTAISESCTDAQLDQLIERAKRRLGELWARERRGD